MPTPDDDLDFLDNDDEFPDEDTQPDVPQLDETGTDPTEG